MKWWPFTRRRSSSCHDADTHLETLRDQQPEVDKLVDRLERRREQNNFRRMFEDALKGGT